MRRSLPIILFFALAAVIIFVVSRPYLNKPKQSHVILISKGVGSGSYLRYATWLQEYNPGITCINVYGLDADSIHLLMKIARGLVLTGGPDVHPSRYKRAGDTILCEDIDLYRDSLEYALMEQALEVRMPILGICRGLQIFNVFEGGSLYADIPTQFPDPVNHRCAKRDTCLHPVAIVDKTFLKSVVEIDRGTVNSSHHQGIRDLAPGLRISSYSPGQLPESIEWEDYKGKGFLLAVQWHPEHLSKDNPMSSTIAKRFLGETFAYDMYKKKN